MVDHTLVANFWRARLLLHLLLLLLHKGPQAHSQKRSVERVKILRSSSTKLDDGDGDETNKYGPFGDRSSEIVLH